MNSLLQRLFPFPDHHRIKLPGGWELRLGRNVYSSKTGEVTYWISLNNWVRK